ncbi:hypothetical protein CARUB_v10024862mg, partial [Capsella rubella]
MSASFAYLRDVRPYKTAWRVQVKVLHSWRQYTNITGETLECIFADDQGAKIHATVKKDLVNRYVNNLDIGDWKFIENFQLTHAFGQFRTTSHLYKMAFINGTVVTTCAPVSDSNYLTLAKFESIQSGDHNSCMLIDVMGQVVNIGEIEMVEANNKPTNKIDFELRNEKDERMPCTLWGSFAERMYRACVEADGNMVVCLLRFAKIKIYKGIKSISNSFDASQLHVNPLFQEVDQFIQSLPEDGLTLTIRQNHKRLQLQSVKRDDGFNLSSDLQVGKARLLCTIYAVDTDWSWYYFEHRNCNKKVTPIHTGGNSVNSKESKPKFWCDNCKSVVTNVAPKYMLYAKVMDATGETKCLLFDSIAHDVIGESATAVLGGSLQEIENPEDLPDQLKNIVGKTFLFLVNVASENIFDGKDAYRVSKVLCKNGLLPEAASEASLEHVDPASIVSGDQLMLTYTDDTTDSSTPSSKRVYPHNSELSEQASTSKKMCTS